MIDIVIKVRCYSSDVKHYCLLLFLLVLLLIVVVVVEVLLVVLVIVVMVVVAVVVVRLKAVSIIYLSIDPRLLCMLI